MHIIQPKTLFIFLILSFLTVGSAIAANYDIKQMTPEITQALGARQNRYGELRQLKASGTLGENNRGYVENRGDYGNELAAAENVDRGIIYRAIAEQNNLGPAGLATIEAVFAEVQRNNAQPGDFIQLPSGEWIQKS